MPSITFGRTLVDGTPRGDGVTVDEEGPTAELLTQRTGPMISNPIVGEWVATLVESHETDGKYERGIAIYAAANDGPPEHVHPNYEERFEVVEGTFMFMIDGTRRPLTAGEHVTVPPGITHTFWNESRDFASCVVETSPAGKLPAVIATLSGLAHDGKLTADGTPRFLQAMVMSADLADDTVFTSPPPIVQRFVSTIIAPIARLAGYRATYAQYLDADYWIERVEQPE